MKRFTTLFLSCAMCACMVSAQDTMPFQAKFFGNLLERNYRSGQSVARATAEDAAEAVIAEDFSKFTKGTEETPDAADLCGDNGAIPEEYTQMPGWEGMGVYQAGGVAYIGMYDSYGREETGYLMTPKADLSANGGFFTVSFRAKSVRSNGDILTLMNLMPGSYSALSKTDINITSEWQDFSVQLSAGAEQSYIQFYSSFGEWFIDDVKVTCDGVPWPEGMNVTGYKGTEATLHWNAVEGADYYVYNLYYFSMDTYKYEYLKKDERVDGTSVTVTGLDSKETYFWQVATVMDGKQSAYTDNMTIKITLGAPVTYQPEDYDGTQFTASWDAVGEGSTYLLKVYSYINGGTFDAEMVPFLEETVTETSYLVTGLDENTIYYYTVQATTGEGEISMTSPEMQVMPEIETPAVTEATEVTENSFVANWTAVKMANKYLATVYKEHTAEADEEYALTDANLESYEPETTYGLTLPRETGAFQWYINVVTTKDGYVGIDNSMAHLLGNGYMYSPLYDLTAFDGKASLDITMSSDDASYAIVSIAVLGEGDVLEEIESYDVPVTSEMTTQHVEFTKGTEKCCVLIHIGDGYNLFFKDFKLTVDMAKGSKVEVPFDNKIVEASEEQNFAVENIEIGKGDRLSYDVMAALVNDEIYVESALSERMYVELKSSVAENEAAARPAVRVSGNELCVENPDAAGVEVFTVAGAKVFSDNSGDAVVRTMLSGKGVYLVKVGDTVTKVCAD